MVDPNLIRPNRWKERWEAGVAPCALCACDKPTVEGWKCFALCEKPSDKPELIEDRESGHCGMFRYRSTRITRE